MGLDTHLEETEKSIPLQPECLQKLPLLEKLVQFIELFPLSLSFKFSQHHGYYSPSVLQFLCLTLKMWRSLMAEVE